MSIISKAAKQLEATGILVDGTVAATTFTGDGSALTGIVTDLSSYATIAYVASELDALSDAPPSTLNTLNKLAAAIGDDPAFSTSVLDLISTKLPLAGGTLTGQLIATDIVMPAGTLVLSNADITQVGGNITTNGTITTTGTVNANIVDADIFQGGVFLGEASFLTGVIQGAEVIATSKLKLGSSASGEFLTRETVNGSYSLGFYTQNAKRIQIETATTTITNDLTVQGNLTIAGTTTVIDTDTSTTEQWLVTNDGTGPAVIINQKGVQPVIDIQDDGNSVFYIEDGGNVGIGTTTPTTALEVIGDIKIKQGSGYSNYSLIDASEALLTLSTYTVNAAAYPADIKFSPNQTERMRITDGGNVGIGTSNPRGDLHLYGSAPQDIVLTNTNADGSVNTLLGRISSQARGYGNDGSNMACIDFMTNSSVWYKGDIVFRTNGSDGTNPAVVPTERMRIESAGKVGIGTSSPLFELHLKKTSGNTRFSTECSADSAAMHQFTDGVKTAYIGKENSTGTYSFSSGGVANAFIIANYGETSPIQIGHNSPSVTITSAGNVGIGTTDPQAKLDVAGGIHISQSSGTILSVHTGTDKTVLSNGWTNGVGDWLKLEVPSADDEGGMLQINSNGNVGIGNATPTQKLDVAGNIAVSGTVDGVDLSEWKYHYDSPNSQHVTNVLTTANGSTVNEYRQSGANGHMDNFSGNHWRYDIVIYGSSDRAHPIKVNGPGANEVVIGRGYSENPKASILSATHNISIYSRFNYMHGGWGGYPDFSINEINRVSYFKGIQAWSSPSHTMDTVWWLRGGNGDGVIYHLYSKKKLTGWKLQDGAVGDFVDTYTHTNPGYAKRVYTVPWHDSSAGGSGTVIAFLVGDSNINGYKATRTGTASDF